MYIFFFILSQETAGVGAEVETPPPADLDSIYNVPRRASVQDAHWSLRNVAGNQTLKCSRHD